MPYQSVSSTYTFYHMSFILCCLFLFFFFTAPATTEIYTLSLHDALPILRTAPRTLARPAAAQARHGAHDARSRIAQRRRARSEEHTSELQSPYDLVCRLLLEKKKKKILKYYT